jgi:Flp pilus assembly protein TadG
MRWRKRGQSLVEMAMIAPFLLMILMMVIDCGRAAYDYSTLAAAAREGARAAITTGSNRPTNGRVLGLVQTSAYGMSLSAASCPNDPVPSNPTMAADTGLVYVGAPSGSAVNTPNAPSGQAPAAAGACSWPVVPSYAGHNPLTVTIKYNFEPLTPFGSQFFPQGIVMTVTSTMSTEY